MKGRLQGGQAIARRYGLRDDQWKRIKDWLPGRKGNQQLDEKCTAGDVVFCPPIIGISKKEDRVCVRSVHESNVFSALGLALSEKQIPRIVENVSN